MSADVPMESTDPQEQPTTEPSDVPEPAEPPQTAEPPEVPKRKQRKPRLSVVTDSQTDLLQNIPIHEPKRPNRRTQTPPSIAVDQNFWSGLIATQRAMRREAKAQRFSNLSIV